MSMTTLTPTHARANLSALLRRALQGDDIGIVVDGKIIALRPVTVESTDYAAREYGATPAELVAFEKRIHAKIAKDRIAGKLHEFTGDLEKLMLSRAARPRSNAAAREPRQRQNWALGFATN